MKLLIAIVVAACGTDAPPPSCQQAMAHYYNAGCVYRDGSGTPINVNAMITTCQQLASTAPANCIDDLNTWLVCNHSVPSPAMGSAECDCSQSQMAILECR